MSRERKNDYICDVSILFPHKNLISCSYTKRKYLLTAKIGQNVNVLDKCQGNETCSSHTSEYNPSSTKTDHTIKFASC